MKNFSNIQRLLICRACKGNNTEKMGLSDDNLHFIYVGWCFDCHDHYVYVMDVQNVRDRKGRI
jgi:hypothetical protein